MKTQHIPREYKLVDALECYATSFYGLINFYVNWQSTNLYIKHQILLNFQPESVPMLFHPIPINFAFNCGNFDEWSELHYQNKQTNVQRLLSWKRYPIPVIGTNWIECWTHLRNAPATLYQHLVVFIHVYKKRKRKRQPHLFAFHFILSHCST